MTGSECVVGTIYSPNRKVISLGTSVARVPISDEVRVDHFVICCHHVYREAAFESRPDRFTIDDVQSSYCPDGLVDIFDDETGHTIFDHFRH